MDVIASDTQVPVVHFWCIMVTCFQNLIHSAVVHTI